MKKICLFLSAALFIFTMSCASLKDAEDSYIEPAPENLEQEENIIEETEIAPLDEFLDTEQTELEETDTTDEAGQSEIELPETVEETEAAEPENIEETPSIAESEDPPQTIESIEEIPPIVEIEEPPPAETDEPAQEPQALSSAAEETEPVETEETQPADEQPAPVIAQTPTEEAETEPVETEEPPPVEERQSIPPLRDVLRDSPPASVSVRDDAPVTPPAKLFKPQEEIVFSRTVRAAAGQIIEIPFLGNGWVYLGEAASRRGIVFNSRRLDPDGMSFIFRTEEAGTYALKFFRQDFIRDFILNDHVQVIVGEAAANSESAAWFNPQTNQDRVIAEPRWPSVLDNSAILRGSVPNSSTSQTVPQTTTSKGTETKETAPQKTAQSPSNANTDTTASALHPPAAAAANQSAPDTPPQTLPVAPPENDAVNESQPSLPQADNLTQTDLFPPDELLKKAKETFDGGNTAAAIALLDQFTKHYPNGSDEAYWLYGQFYEANTPNRNILLSLDYLLPPPCKRIPSEQPP